jgi:anti-anti-sigma regulatory factor/anti-sigma regulatory factor (Ser/Thr protein kinase)
MSAVELICTYEPDFPAAILHVSGRLTFATVPKLREAARKALTDHPEVLLVDVSALAAVDDITLTAFRMIARQSVEAGTDVMMIAPGAELREQLDRLGIARRVPVHDDAAVALAAHATLPGPRRLDLVLPPRPEATAAARELVDRACAQWRTGYLADSAALIVTELVANGIEHAGTPMRLSIAHRTWHLHLALRDESPLPLRRVGGDDDDRDSGRGLLIVEAMASAWGCVRTPGGKVVWATLRLRPGQ